MKYFGNGTVFGDRFEKKQKITAKKMTPAEIGSLEAARKFAIANMKMDLEEGIEVTYAVKANRLRKAKLNVIGWIGRTGHMSQVEIKDMITGRIFWVKI